eukprot:CAMPEP_0170828340 /NCGR_PEP_ID=MMETSP0733-20121128/47856_1 /TAXON_ID=186038 /ORGANISM="Fragilariopsis kerguelensis, Strain L26-C5" /LENGTH=54 /DNA_ID=CAMNT_0011192791 /DNA_START=15 /DNA_END=176 /DNA_ORIENTATION=-
MNDNDDDNVDVSSLVENEVNGDKDPNCIHNNNDGEGSGGGGGVSKTTTATITTK